MQPNYDAMTNEQETSLLWTIMQEEGFNPLDNNDVNAVLREELNDAVIAAYQAENDDDTLSGLTQDVFESPLEDEVGKMKDGIFSFGDVYSELKEQFYNAILDRWVEENPNLAYPITYIEVSNDPKSRSISDDDLCASCALLAYCPGENSVCRKVAGEYDADWPAEFDEDGYAVECDQFIDIADGGTNWVLPEGECA